ncbi:MAG: hypothetical protein JEZ04_16505 [Spirochaetales bacterium]|nr:hypothetical protein [Spirochaetales bacterium]
MPYCPRCGVEVDYNITECPLCSFSIPEIPYEVDIKKEEIELKNYYEELKVFKQLRKKRGKAIAFIVIVLIVIFTGFNNTMQDWYANGQLTFSPYVLSSLGMFIGILICLFGFIKNWKAIFLFLFCLTVPFLFSLDLYRGEITWFWTAGLPITISSFTLVFLPAIIIKNHRKGGLFASGVVLTAGALLSILVELILDLNSGNIELTWSFQASITAGSLAFIFLLARKIIRQSSFKKLKRYFHF